ncbi:MAG: tRNA uridine-5-carboxymethylaminomethyl(34) synthesis GTPase MnmE [Treponema sp.]|nr:tRNA uridine-5-carboxymethylaminomethyl(34) synthesis GTPase MnmE [Treponema sp.]
MKQASYGDRDPVYALATPMAESALALIRTSGNGGEDGRGAIELLAGIFSRPEKLLSAKGSSLVQGWICAPDKPDKVIPDKAIIDQVVVSLYRAPRSYTGEDAADISCHGGIATVKAISAALEKAGFRQALPGEFSFRAFMNGKLDLTRAESVMELVSAKTDRGREQALRRLAGVLEKEISGIKALLVELLAATEIYLDYSEDEFLDGDGNEEAGRLPGRKLAEEAAARLKTLAELWRQERIYAEGALAVLAGRPNAGKSSLFNYLIREDRSIVTARAGTTRDWIEAQISIEGIPLRLADTAGLRLPDFSPSPDDEAERLGIQRSRELVDRADLLLYLLDGTEGLTEDDREFLSAQKEAVQPKPLLVLWNKADIADPPLAPPPEPLLAVSAKTGEGVAELLRAIAGLLETAPHLSAEPGTEAGVGPGSLRQKELIDSALAAVQEALGLADREEPLDIIAPQIRSAVNALGEITGEVSSADILEVMFRRFCVGK